MKGLKYQSKAKLFGGVIRRETMKPPVMKSLVISPNFRIFKWVWVNTYRYIFSGMNIHLPAILGFTRGTRVLTHPQIVTHLQIDIDPKMLDPWAKYSRGGAPQQQRRGGQGWGWRRRQWTGLLDLGLGLSLATGAGSGEISGDFWSIIL